jgi:hypothetical protein
MSALKYFIGSVVRDCYNKEGPRCKRFVTKLYPDDQIDLLNYQGTQTKYFTSTGSKQFFHVRFQLIRGPFSIPIRINPILNY